MNTDDQGSPKKGWQKHLHRVQEALTGPDDHPDNVAINADPRIKGFANKLTAKLYAAGNRQNERY